jgi:hypothetical protein
VITDRHFNRGTPLTQRNLAGFLNSVSYMVNNEIPAEPETDPNPTGQPVITATLAVPEGLFAPVVQGDVCVGNPCSGSLMWRIDSGPLVTGDSEGFVSTLANRVTTIRAFIVNGNAPNALTDRNRDGLVDTRDAVLAGHKILSNQVTFRIRNIYETHCFYSVQDSEARPSLPLFPGVVLNDLDGNDAAPTLSCPASPGGITRIPR